MFFRGVFKALRKTLHDLKNNFNLHSRKSKKTFPESGNAFCLSSLFLENNLIVINEAQLFSGQLLYIII